MTIRFTRRGALGLAGGLAAGPAFGQAWPERSLRWMVGYAAGGASDLFARLLGRHISAAVGQQVVVENRPSGGAIVATEAVIRAPADGYTVLHVDNGMLVYNPALYSRLPFDPDRDLTSVGFIGRFPFFVVVRSDSPHADFAALLAASRRDAVTYATPAVASPHQLAMEILKRRSGLNATHVPYRGIPAVLTALAAGEVDCAVLDVTNATPQLTGGRARGLVCLGEARTARAPQIPTALELGYANTVAYGWMGLSVATGTPAPLIGRWNELLNAAVASAEVQRQFAETGAEPVPRSPAEMTAFVQAENALWRPLIRELGIRLDG